jgi:AmmeMemoRadiSam system protein A
MLSKDERRTLLSIARRSLQSAMARRTGPGGESIPPQVAYEGQLATPGGAFVTLRKSGDLRGCIGYLESSLPLGRVVEEVAEKAAFEDPRFHPLTPPELQQIVIEISVLSPFRRVHDIAEIQVGEHGLMIELGHSRGVLLPQVAVEYGWDRAAFLSHVARKAGLHPDAWKDPSATVYIFEAEIIQEASDD